MSKEAFKNERINVIDDCLSNRKQVKWTKERLIDEINNRLSEKGRFDNRIKREEGIHEKTFYNDLKYLKEIKNAPIEIKNGAYFYKSPFSLNTPVIDDEAAQKLHTAIALLKQLDAVPYLTEIEGLITKLESASFIDHQPEQAYIQFEHHTEFRGLDQYFDILFESIRLQQPLKIVYQRFFADKAKTHLYHPYLLKEYHNRWYLFGKINDYDNISTLALDRIKKVEPAEIPFQSLPGFDANKYFKNAIGISFVNDTEPEEIQIRVLKHQVPYFENQPLHKSQKKLKTYANGDVLFSLFVFINIELKLLLMQYAHTLKVISPGHLKTELTGMIQKALKLNK